MIKDAGFTIKSEISLDELMQKKVEPAAVFADETSAVLMKGIKELRPELQV